MFNFDDENENGKSQLTLLKIFFSFVTKCLKVKYDKQSTFIIIADKNFRFLENFNRKSNLENYKLFLNYFVFVSDSQHLLISRYCFFFCDETWAERCNNLFNVSD